MNSGYAVLDGTAMKLVDQHGGDYSYVLIWSQYEFIFTFQGANVSKMLDR
jgi:hypothetical protein